MTAGERWVNADGSTSVEGFLAAYAADDNTFWRVDIGHIQNVLDDTLDNLEAAMEALTAIAAFVEHPTAIGPEAMFQLRSLIPRSLIAAYHASTTDETI